MALEPHFANLSTAARVTRSYSACTPGGAVAGEVEAVLFRRDGHDGRVDQAQLHDPGVVAPQTGRVMQPYPR